MTEIYCETIDISSSNYHNAPKSLTGLQVYKIRLSSFYGLITSLSNYLTEEELQRSNRYHFEKDKNQFIICRALLKHLLARYSDLKINQIEIKEDENKKPYLSLNPSIHFNISHSEDIALIALNKEHVGVDIECVKKDFNFSEMLDFAFGPEERMTIENAGNSRQMFYTLWTRKEALLKALGFGLAIDLPQVKVMDGLQRINPEIFGNVKLSNVYSFSLDMDYVGSIAVNTDNTDMNLTIRDVPKSLETLMLG